MILIKSLGTMEQHQYPVDDIQAQFPIVEFDMTMADLRAKRNKLLADTDHLCFIRSILLSA
jgi:hypothetical protein